MITKSTANELLNILSNARKTIKSEYEKINKKFTELLQEHGEFEPTDYTITYTGCEFPSECKIEKCYCSPETNRIMCALRDIECGVNFNVPITDLEQYEPYGQHILNLYGQAIYHFTEK